MGRGRRDRGKPWRRRAVAGVLAILGLIHPPAPVFAQAAPDLSALTAEELLTRGSNAYQAGRFAEARLALERFVSAYGESAEASAVLERVLPLLAAVQIREKQFGDALATIDRFFAKVGAPKPDVAADLQFWRGVCLIERGDTGAARETLLRFLQEHPTSSRREEALLLAAACSSLAGRPAESAEFLAPHLDRLSPANRGRAVVMRLHALIQARRIAEAHALLVAEFPKAETNLQIVSFHSLALELGSHYLEEGKPREAISCLQRVWSRDRLIRHQERRLAEWDQQLAAARQQTADAFRMLTLDQMIAKTRRELDHFRKIESFDAALRFRLARAFLDMGRFREAALILEGMVADLPPDQVVEEASLTLIRCWMQVERWPRAADAARVFAGRFPKSKRLPEARFLGAQSLQSGGEIDASITAFRELAAAHAESPFAARAKFMEGFGELLREDPVRGLKIFGEVATYAPSAEVAELTWYWTGMAHSLAKEHEKAREVLADYLKKHPDGRFAGEALYRRAYCAHALRDYPTGIRELRAFLAEHADHARANEARILLGDALMATGEIDKGIVALRGVTAQEPRLFEEAVFKVGRAFRLQERPDLLRAEMERFIKERPASARVPEAVYWIGWTWRQTDQPELAIETYWQAIRAHGDAPERHAVEDLLMALPKLYAGAERRAELEALLARLQAEAETAGRNAMAARTAWMRARLREKSAPEEARALRIRAAELCDVSRAHPLILADAADAHLDAGDPAAAERALRELLRWNPNTVLRDRAFAGLGRIAADAGRSAEALEWFDRFEREASGSPMAGRVALARAALLRSGGREEEAAGTLEKMLAIRGVPAAEKARGLLELGEVRMAQGKPRLAVPYFQRIYVMYGRWPDLVARAYLRSGEAFEKLADSEAARNTYRELLAREDLAGFDEVRVAKERLARLESAGGKGGG